MHALAQRGSDVDQCIQRKARHPAAQQVWAEIAQRRGLAEPDVTCQTSPWHTDTDLGRPIEVVTDISKSRRPGFTAYLPTDDAFLELFVRLHDDRLISQASRASIAFISPRDPCADPLRSPRAVPA
ncbi:MAG: NAD-dependent epimerase/dehydratase [Nevskia sp.]|nr:NAD-dependent epimerase/dehydratase [Nevskia sp.]